jgi:divalent metal cation (Fe/Co/Zn/Cd) transporter
VSELAVAPIRDDAWIADARRARQLGWLSLTFLAIVAAVGIAAGVRAGSVALTGFGADSAIEGLAALVVIWRYSGSSDRSEVAERRAQRLVGLGLLLLAPCVAAAATRDLVLGSHPDTSWLGVALAAASLAALPPLRHARRRVGERLDPEAAEIGNVRSVLCSYLAAAALIGLAGNALLSAPWLDPAAALMIAGVALEKGRLVWQGEDCGC